MEKILEILERRLSITKIVMLLYLVASIIGLFCSFVFSLGTTTNVPLEFTAMVFITPFAIAFFFCHGCRAAIDWHYGTRPSFPFIIGFIYTGLFLFAVHPIVTSLSKLMITLIIILAIELMPMIIAKKVVESTKRKLETKMGL
jgi:hypothetical protein